MARNRIMMALSYDPANADAVRVMDVLDETTPRGQRSATIWKWLAAYLDGKALVIEDDEPTDDGVDDLLDNL